MALMVDVKSTSILLYGGIDLSKSAIYSDAYLYNQQQWRPLTVSNQIAPRINAKTTTCNNRTFLFGGEGPSENNTLFFNDLYEMTVSEESLQLIFKLVVPYGPLPKARASHGMVTVDGRILIYGG